MKNVNLSLIACFVCCLADHCSFAQSGNAGFSVEAVGSQIIPLTINKMTNIVFPVAIKPGIKVSRDIFSERPKGTTNVLVLKAARRGFAPTNLSVYGQDGRLYSFELRYFENPAVLNFRIVGEGFGTKLPLERDAEAIGGEKAFMQHSAANLKMQLILQGIYLRDGVMWFSLSLRNHSAIRYSPESVRWVVKDTRRLKRTAIQEIVLSPEYMGPVVAVPGDSSTTIVAGFRPFTLAKDKMLSVEIEQKEGGRLALSISHRMILKGKSVKDGK